MFEKSTDRADRTPMTTMLQSSTIADVDISLMITKVKQNLSRQNLKWQSLSYFLLGHVFFARLSLKSGLTLLCASFAIFQAVFTEIRFGYGQALLVGVKMLNAEVWG